MKKIFIILAFAGVMAACGGEGKKQAADEQEKSLAEQIIEARANGDDEQLGLLMVQFYELPQEEQDAIISELAEYEAVLYGPEAG